jgi:hypothetical protein
MSYGTIWLLIIGAGVVGIGAAYMLVIRRVPSGYLRALACALILALLWTPAPIPGYPSNYAPAFIVVVFEGLLQASGNPWVAVRLLLAGVTLAIAAVTLATFGWRRRRRASEPAEAVPEGD